MTPSRSYSLQTMRTKKKTQIAATHSFLKFCSQGRNASNRSDSFSFFTVHVQPPKTNHGAVWGFISSIKSALSSGV